MGRHFCKISVNNKKARPEVILRAGRVMNLKGCNHRGVTENSERICVCRRYMPEQILRVEGPKAFLGELPAAFNGVNGFTRKLLELLHSHHNRSAVPVCRQQVAGVFCFSHSNINCIVPVAGTSR